MFLDLRPLNKSEVFANAFSGSFDPDGNLIDDKLRQLIADQLRALANRVRPSS